MHFGAMATIKLNPAENLGIQPSLFITKKGATNYNFSPNDLKSTSRINYIELSVPYNFYVCETIDMGTWGLYTGLEPYMAIATGGKAKIEDLNQNFRKEKLNFGNRSNDHFRRFDAGLGLGHRHYL